jgi:hypothetical protein
VVAAATLSPSAIGTVALGTFFARARAVHVPTPTITASSRATSSSESESKIAWIT